MNKLLDERLSVPAEHRVAMGQGSREVSSWVVPGRKPDLVSSFRAHLRLALWLMFGVLGVGALLILLLVPRTYLAQATLRVTPTYVASLSLNSEVRFDTGVEYHDYVQQQIYEIESYANAMKTLDVLGPKRELFQQPGETARHAAERLLKLLDVQAIPDTYLITIGLEGTDPKATADVVNAVAQAYLARHAEQELELNRERLHQLTNRKSQLEGQIQLRSGQLDQIAQVLGTSSFDSGMGNPYDKMRVDAATALDSAKHALIKADAHLSAVQSEQVRLQKLELDSAAEQMLEGSADLTAATAQLRKQREANFLELRGLAANHPGRKALEQAIADINNEIKRLRENALSKLRSMLQEQRTTKAQQQLDASEARVEETQREEQGLETQVANLEKKAAWFASKYNQGLVLQAAIERDQKEVQDIDSRLTSVLTEAHTPGIVQLEASAQVPEMPEKARRRKIGLVVALLALVLGAGVPTFIDLTDGRVKSVAELEEIIGIPALGAVKLGSSFERIPSRDLLRRVALAIVRECRRSGSRLFVLTSVEKGGGTTSLALALERELTLAGANAVALEANPLSPDSRYRHPRLGDRSSSSVRVYGTVSDRGQYSTPPQPNLDRVDRDFLSHIVVTRPHGDVEIAAEPLRRLLDEQLAKRDIVLLDAAPLLNSADTEMLIQMPAATILIVQAGEDRVERVKATAEAISRISPPVVGAVLLHRSSTAVTLEQTPAGRAEAVQVTSLRDPAKATLARGALASNET